MIQDGNGLIKRLQEFWKHQQESSTISKRPCKPLTMGKTIGVAPHLKSKYVLIPGWKLILIGWIDTLQSIYG